MRGVFALGGEIAVKWPRDPRHQLVRRNVCQRSRAVIAAGLAEAVGGENSKKA